MVGHARDVVEQVRAQTDIADLIGSYIPLRRTGQNLKALCPFHEEKTPSFMVSPARQTFHCFGCGERGGVFDFVMRMERVDFKDALQVLADRAGIELRRTAEGREGPSRADLYRVHEWAQARYRRLYASSEGEACRDYVASRRIDARIVETFGLGFAPDAWRTLVGGAEDDGIPLELLERGGLALRGATRPGLYDRFRGRLTFPIRDALERVVGFGARNLDGSEPKYLNSPETEIFHKGRLLFGLDHLRGHRREAPVLVMEGYTDVMMTAQVGVPGAVATLGTSLTPEHARLLSRYSDRIILVYDGDAAGVAAAERGARLLLEAGHLDIQVAVLPEGQDPCDYFLARGEAGFADLLDATVDLVDFLLERTSGRHDLSTLAGRRRASEDLVRAAAMVKDPVARDLILGRIADRLRLGKPPLEDQVEAIQRARSSRRRPAPESSRGAFGAESTAQLHVVQALLNDPALLLRLDPEVIPVLPSPAVRRLVRRLRELAGQAPGPPGRLLDALEEPSLRDLARKALLPEGHGLDLGSQLEGALSCLKNRRSREEARRLGEQAVAEDDPELLKKAQQRYRILKSGKPMAPGNAHSAAGTAPGEPSDAG